MKQFLLKRNKLYARIPIKVELIKKVMDATPMRAMKIGVALLIPESLKQNACAVFAVAVQTEPKTITQF